MIDSSFTTGEVPQRGCERGIPHTTLAKALQGDAGTVSKILSRDDVVVVAWMTSPRHAVDRLTNQIAGDVEAS
jgi:hypothetical protein